MSQSAVGDVFLQNVVTKEDFGLIDFLPKLFPLFINPLSASPEYIQF